MRVIPSTLVNPSFSRRLDPLARFHWIIRVKSLETRIQVVLVLRGRNDEGLAGEGADDLASARFAAHID